MDLGDLMHFLKYQTINNDSWGESKMKILFLGLLFMSTTVFAAGVRCQSEAITIVASQVSVDSVKVTIGTETVMGDGIATSTHVDFVARTRSLGEISVNFTGSQGYLFVNGGRKPLSCTPN